jgi:isopenicillin N synthase-like dioxygenase
MKVMPEMLLDTLDPPSLLSDSEFSHSIMGLYHYYPQPHLTETCTSHTDMGLISFIPKSEVDGLQALDYEHFKWVKYNFYSIGIENISIGYFFVQIF